MPHAASPADFQQMAIAASSTSSMDDVVQRGLMLIGSSAPPPMATPAPTPLTTPQQTFGWPYEHYGGAPTPQVPSAGLHRSPSMSLPGATPSPAVTQVVNDLRNRLAQEQQRNAMAVQALMARETEVHQLRHALQAKTLSADQILQELVKRQNEMQGGGGEAPLPMLQPPPLPDPDTLPPVPGMLFDLAGSSEPAEPVSPASPKAPVNGQLHAATPRHGKKMLKELKDACEKRAERIEELAKQAEEEAARAAKEAEDAAIRAKLEDEVRAKIAEEVKAEAAAARAAKKAVGAKGPSGWRSVEDEYGRVYYANDETGESSWSIPKGVTLDDGTDGVADEGIDCGGAAAIAEEMKRKEAAWAEERAAWAEERAAWASREEELVAKVQEESARREEAERQVWQLRHDLDQGGGTKPRGLAGLMSAAKDRMEAAAEAEEREASSAGGKPRSAKRGSFLERCKHSDPPAKRQALGFRPSSANNQTDV